MPSLSGAPKYRDANIENIVSQIISTQSVDTKLVLTENLLLVPENGGSSEPIEIVPTQVGDKVGDEVPIGDFKLKEGSGIILTPDTVENLVLIDSTGGSGSGDVAGPGSATVGNIATFDNVNGKEIKDSGVLVDTDGDISGVRSLAIGSASAIDTTATELGELTIANAKMEKLSGGDEGLDSAKATEVLITRSVTATSMAPLSLDGGNTAYQINMDSGDIVSGSVAFAEMTNSNVGGTSSTIIDNDIGVIEIKFIAIKGSDNIVVNQWFKHVSDKTRSSFDCQVFANSTFGIRFQCQDNASATEEKHFIAHVKFLKTKNTVV